MALGIGSCVTVFSMVSAVLLAGWPYAGADRLAIVWHARQGVPGVIGMSPADYQAYRASMPSFERVAAVTTRGYNAGSGNPFRVTCARMTPEMFPLLGTAPARGRWFTEDDDRRREKVVVVSGRMWRTQLGANPGLAGRDLALDAVVHRVIGIMPEAFVFPPDGAQGLSSADCWLPASFSPAELAIPSFSFVLFGRLRGAATLAAAGAEANVSAQRIWSSYPAAVQGQIKLEARVVRLADQALAASRTPLYLFIGAAAVLLLIGCSNVASFLLAGLDRRRRELALRAALGATRVTLIAQLLIESLVLAFAGGLGGLLLASIWLSGIVAANPGLFPRLGDAGIDLPAVVFAVACSALAGLLGGLAPAWQLRDAQATLAGSRPGPSGFGRDRWRRGLLAFEVALSVAVLVLAVVLTRSVIGLNDIGAGFAPDGMLTFSVALPDAQYPRDKRVAFAAEVLRRLERLPGVERAAAGAALPIGAANPAVVIPASETTGPPQYRPALQYAVTAEYADASGIALREGRFLDAHDVQSGARVAVVNESLSRALWQNGRSVRRNILQVGDQSPVAIVGVVAGVRQAGPLRDPAPALYVPISRPVDPLATVHFLVRSESSARVLVPRIREIVAGLDAGLPPFAFRTGGELVSGTMASLRFNMFIVGVIALLAVSLALIGAYGVLSHFVQQGRRDFGIRQALGATSARIVGSVMTWALAPVAIGVAAGALLAAGTSSLVASLLFGVLPSDPLTLFVVAIAVAILAGAAMLPAAMRASRGDVAALLRQE